MNTGELSHEQKMDLAITRRLQWGNDLDNLEDKHERLLMGGAKDNDAYFRQLGLDPDEVEAEYLERRQAV